MIFTRLCRCDFKSACSVAKVYQLCKLFLCINQNVRIHCYCCTDVSYCNGIKCRIDCFSAWHLYIEYRSVRNSRAVTVAYFYCKSTACICRCTVYNESFRHVIFRSNNISYNLYFRQRIRKCNPRIICCNIIIHSGYVSDKCERSSQFKICRQINYLRRFAFKIVPLNPYFRHSSVRNVCIKHRLCCLWQCKFYQRLREIFTACKICFILIICCEIYKIYRCNMNRYGNREIIVILLCNNIISTLRIPCYTVYIAFCLSPLKCCRNLRAVSIGKNYFRCFFVYVVYQVLNRTVFIYFIS